LRREGRKTYTPSLWEEKGLGDELITFFACSYFALDLDRRVTPVCQAQQQQGGRRDQGDDGKQGGDQRTAL